MSRQAFTLIGLFWLALIDGLLGFKEYTLLTGQDMVLRTVSMEDGYAKATGAYPDRPDGLVPKGRFTPIQNGQAWLDYGINSYFVPEGRGREIERLARPPDVRASIDRFGNAVILALVIDGAAFSF